MRASPTLGFDPAWSPDGGQIAFATEEIYDPRRARARARCTSSTPAGGSPRKVVEGDAVQPSWSPSGQHIVYWSNTGGQRDIYSVAAAGGAPVPVTQDAAIDWSPVWSPDGRFIYFSSDRGGAMNLWRIAIDHRPASERGAGGGDRRRAGLRGPSAVLEDGSRLVFRSRVASINPSPSPSIRRRARRRAVVLDTRNNVRMPSDVSADGKQIAYFSIADHQEDIFVGPPDGRCGASPTTRRGIARRCSRRTGARSSSIRTATATGPHGRSASTAAICARSSARQAGRLSVVSPKGDPVVFVA